MKNAVKKIVLLSLILSFTHCKEKVVPEPEAVNKGSTLSLTAYNQSRKYSLNEPENQTTDEEKNKKDCDDCPCPCDDKEKTKPETKTDPDITNTTTTVADATETKTNPLLNNASIKEAFDAYKKLGIDDSAFDDVAPLLDDETLPEADQKKLVEQFFKIIELNQFQDEKTMNDFLESYSLSQRIIGVFNLYSISPLFVSAIREKLKEEPLLKGNISEQDQKIAEPFLYITGMSHRFYVNPTPNSGFDIYDSVNSKGEKTHFVILGRIDFSAGKAKQKLTEEDESNLNTILNFWAGWLKSDARSSVLKFKILSHEDSPASKNPATSAAMKRGNLVYEYIKPFISAGTELFTLEAVGDQYPWKADSKDDANRRVEFVISYEPVKAETTTAAEAPTETSTKQ